MFLVSSNKKVKIFKFMKLLVSMSKLISVICLPESVHSDFH